MPQALLTAPERGTERYLARVETALENWFLLTGSPVELGPFRRLTAGLDPLPAAATWRQHSTLCADGAPVEFCHRLGGDPAAPAYTVDCGPYGAPCAVRDHHTLRTARAAAAAIGSDLSVAASLDGRRQDLPDQTCWLGATHSRSGPPRLKVYASVGRRGAPAGEQRALGILSALGRPPRPATRAALRVLRSAGRFRQIALTAGGGAVRAKLYYRMARVDLPLLERLAERAGIPPEPFTAYARRVLGAPAGWHDPEAGIAVGLDREGGLDEVALYHYTRFYFRDDAALRRRVLDAGPAFRWAMDAFRPASRLLAGGRRRTLGLMGFGARRSESPGLHLYQSSGFLARHDPDGTNEEEP